MTGRTPAPVILQFDIEHGVFAEHGRVLLHVFEARGDARAFPSASYYRLFRDGVLETEHKASSFFVSVEGRYTVVALWDDGRTGETPAVFVTAGMIRDAAKATRGPRPSVQTYDPHTHRFDRRTGMIVPRFRWRWAVLVAGLVLLLAAALLL